MTRTASVFRRAACALMAALFAGAAFAADVDAGFEDEEEVSAEELRLEKIPVDERIFLQRWNTPPFDQRYFTYNDEELREKWDYLMRGLRIPFPSSAFLRLAHERYAFIRDSMGPDFNGDFDALEKVHLDLWRGFFAGDYQRVRNEGLKHGVMGMVPALFSQLMYAMYLAERQSDKYMLLQDVANRIEPYLKQIEKSGVMNDPDARTTGAAALLGYAYSIARIAEESPIAVAVARRYPNKLRKAADDLIDAMPDHPMALGFRAGLDSGIMRRVGKFTGRVTYGARFSNVEEGFEQSLAIAPDIPITVYEYGNALIYTNRRRDLNEALALFEKASLMQPQFAMDALDAMYAYKRLQEIKLFALNYRSFRRFEKDRRRFIKTTDRNLTSVIAPILTQEMLDNPERFALASRQ